ncbi:hypothetical protein BST91_09705 [Nonlabens tegetincola]|uniref:S8 family serine peptidase n=1 Tax=Nonlabens tegetincola TaxID=323273 RepID=UPI000A20667A|nr:S8 family serine peptidase [Nonlabens tegetincola]ARN71904.1 hypothetical protein BST91_09705 [Nonlabens tegetincola]
MKLYKLLLITFFAISATAQNDSQLEFIISNTNVSKLHSLKNEVDSYQVENRDKAFAIARQLNMPVIITNEDGSFDELMGVSDNGSLLYYTVHNVDAARSTRTNTLHNGGLLNLDIEGQGMTMHVWDGGPVRISHREFGPSRASIGDNATQLNGNSFHATHVSGTTVARGVDPLAKGMAPQAEVISYDWSSDYSEMIGAAANGALISNHSYGFRAASLDDEIFGKYIQNSQIIDEICFNAPYYLPVISAGNDGNDDSSNSTPLFNNPQFDKLSGNSTSKNPLIVANAQDANIGNDGSFISGVINSGSSEGPTDDLRVKPDITGNGTGLYSSFDGSDNDYNSISGTSMSAPNVAGSILLLQQLYSELNGVFMRSATAKGLVLHTAEDIGLPGPDAVTGWGYMNTMDAANTILNDKLSSRIVERTINNGETHTFTVKSNSLSTLKASLSWTDPAGTINSGGINDNTPALMNDLDIRISQSGNNFFPWKLTGVNSNGVGDNLVDNFERIDVDNPSGTYTISITHKGTLVNPQQYTLIVTGEQNDFAVRAQNRLIEVCNNDSPVINLEFLTDQNFSGNVNLSVNNLPQGANAVFSSNSFSSSGSGTLTITNLNNVVTGFYNLDIIADDGFQTVETEITLRVLSSNFNPITGLTVSGNPQSTPIPVRIIWDENINAQSYDVEISPSNSFSRPFIQSTSLNNSYVEISNQLVPSNSYYVRVKPINQCGEGTWTVFQFTTFDCTDYDDSITTPISIPDNDNVGIENSININDPANPIIDKLTVSINSNHEYAGDLVFTLITPAGNEIQLNTTDSCDSENIDVTFDDGGSDLICNLTSPAYRGLVRPVEPLSSVTGLNINGNWTLKVQDLGPQDLGVLNSWKLTFCTAVPLSNTDTSIVDFELYPNPAQTIVYLRSEDFNLEEANINIYDIHGKVIKKSPRILNNKDIAIDVADLSPGFYLLSISKNGFFKTHKLIIK